MNYDHKDVSYLKKDDKKSKGYSFVEDTITIVLLGLGFVLFYLLLHTW